MRINWLGTTLKAQAAMVLIVLGLGRAGAAQEVSAALLRPVAMESGTFEASPMVRTVQPANSRVAEENHRFWDRENTFLLAANAAFSAADFVVTRDNLRGGGQELNPITRVFSGSSAGLAMNFAGETAGVVGLSYFFHKTGHHKMERAVSMLNIGSSATAVTFDLARR
jgi:hypothetical protein